MIRRRGAILSILTAGLLVAAFAMPTTSGAALTYTYLTQWGGTGTAAGDLAVPFNVAVDSTGKVYTTEQQANPARGQVFTTNGSPLLIFGGPGTGDGKFLAPESLAVAYNGDIYVCDSGNDRIMIFDAKGNYSRQFGTSGSGQTDLDAPSGIAINKFGHVYVVDSNNDRIQVFDAKGTWLFGWGGTGSGNFQFSEPQEIALDPIGNVYVADQNNHRILKYSAKGGYFTRWGTNGTADSQFDYPTSVGCDPWGRVYVCDSGNDRMQVFDAIGGHLATFGTTGSNNSQFDVPWGVAADSYRNVFVADTWNYRVQKFGAPQPTYVWVGAGQTRIQTAIKVTEYGWPVELSEDADGYNTAIIATARNWPDALAAAALSGAVQGPILLVEPNSLPAEVAAEIERLGVGRVFVMGGTGAVSDTVKAAIDDIPGVDVVERIGGATRYETAEMIAARVREIIGEDFDGGAIVATGRAFPDALAGAPISYARCWPILLAASDGLPKGMDGVDRVAILGGDGAVSAEVEAALVDSLGSAEVTRVAGATRYQTAIETAHWSVINAGLHWSHTAVSTGRNWPDALAGGPLQGRYQSVMLLTPPDSAHPDVIQTVEDMQRGIGELRFIGGSGAISEDVRNTLVSKTIDPQ